MNENNTCKNEDVEIWRQYPDDYYSPSIHVTKQGKIGIDVGGLVVVKDVKEWHSLASKPSEEHNQDELWDELIDILSLSLSEELIYIGDIEEAKSKYTITPK